MKSNGSGQPGGKKRAGSDQKIASSFRFLDVVGLLVALSLGGWTLMDAIRPGSPRGSPEIYYGGLDDLDLGPRCDIKVVDGASLTAEEFDAFAATLCVSPRLPRLPPPASSPASYLPPPASRLLPPASRLPHPTPRLLQKGWRHRPSSTNIDTCARTLKTTTMQPVLA